MKNTKAEQLELKLHERLISILIGIIEHLVQLFEDVDNDSLIANLIHDEKIFKQIKTLMDMENQQHNRVA